MEADREGGCKKVEWNITFLSEGGGMKIEDIKKTTVIGAGAMGAQIAEVLSRMGGYEVWMVDINDELVRKGFQSIEDQIGSILCFERQTDPGREEKYCKSNQREHEHRRSFQRG